MADLDRKRASLFETEPTDTSEARPKLDLSGFSPKKAPPVDPDVMDDVVQQTGFVTKHAPAKSPAPKKRDGRRLKKSARTSQFNIRLKPTNADRFWDGVEAKGMEYADDFLEYLLDLYDSQ